MITPEPGALVVGSTPSVAPTRQALGVLFVGPIGTMCPQPSWSKFCIDAAHLGVKSGFNAIRNASMGSKCARLAV